jgi:hypothetical protein
MFSIVNINHHIFNFSRFDGTKGWLWSDTSCSLKLNYICQHSEFFNILNNLNRSLIYYYAEANFDLLGVGRVILAGFFTS